MKKGRMEVKGKVGKQGKKEIKRGTVNREGERERSIECMEGDRRIGRG